MSFDIINTKGRAMQAKTPSGKTVTRVGSLFTEEFGLTQCADYWEHFIYENPDKTPGRSSFMCTCGSMAVIANPYQTRNKQFVCHHHATYGVHTTSHVNKKDFEKGTPQIMKAKRWI